MGDYPMPSSNEWENQDVMKIKVYQDSQGNKVYGFTDGVKVSQDSQKVYGFTDGGEPTESMDAGGGGETWQEGLRRHREEMEMDMLRFEVEDAVLDPDALLDQEKKPKEGAAFGKANEDEPEPAAKFLARIAAQGRIAACCQNDEDM